MQPRSTPQGLKWLAAGICLGTGVVSAYAFKVMNHLTARPCLNCQPQHFNGAFLQTFLMFIAESSCYLFYWIDTTISRRQRKRRFLDFVTLKEHLDLLHFSASNRPLLRDDEMITTLSCHDSERLLTTISDPPPPVQPGPSFSVLGTSLGSPGTSLGGLGTNQGGLGTSHAGTSHGVLGTIHAGTSLEGSGMMSVREVPLLTSLSDQRGGYLGGENRSGIFDTSSDNEIIMVEKSMKKKKRGNWYDWIFPSSCDLIGSTLCNISLILTYASTVQMLRNSLVVCCALLQVLYLKKNLSLGEVIGVFGITLAMILAAIPAILNPDESSSTSTASGSGSSGSSASSGSSSGSSGSSAMMNSLIGIILAFVGTGFSSIQIMFEERLFRKSFYSPMKAVCIEGLSGMIILLLLIFPFLIYFNFENIYGGIYQIFFDIKMMLIVISYLISGMLFNATGIATTKLSGGLLRSIIFAVRAPIIWGLDLLLGWINFDYFNGFATIFFLISFSLYSLSQ